MKPFVCACGARIFFENSRCLSCQRELGFLPGASVLSALESAPDGTFKACSEPLASYRKCENYVEAGVCNWMVEEHDPEPLCLACRLNHVIPNLSNEENRRNWAEVEAAKRRLVYSLNRLHLPIVPKSQDPEGGLAFDIQAEIGSTRVLTGHADGLVTLNLAEADTVIREKTRLELNERYRTLLGHFRHEVGHYYWDVLIRDGADLEPFRALFGDEREDYAAALARHYEARGTKGYSEAFISAYASSHPWEDWAESWAHYLHMVDTLETGHAFDFLKRASVESEPADAGGFEFLFRDWLELVVVLNALNRSMGLPDAYPFPIGAGARDKLAFVHQIVQKAALRPDSRQASQGTSIGVAEAITPPVPINAPEPIPVPVNVPEPSDAPTSPEPSTAPPRSNTSEPMSTHGPYSGPSTSA